MRTTQFQLLVHFATQLITLVWSVPYLLNSASGSCALAVCVWISWCHAPVVHSNHWHWGTWGNGSQNINWRRHYCWCLQCYIHSASVLRLYSCLWLSGLLPKLCSRFFDSNYIISVMWTANILMILKYVSTLMLLSGRQYRYNPHRNYVLTETGPRVAFGYGAGKI